MHLFYLQVLFFLYSYDYVVIIIDLCNNLTLHDIENNNPILARNVLRHNMINYSFGKNTLRELCIDKLLKSKYLRSVSNCKDSSLSKSTNISRISTIINYIRMKSNLHGKNGFVKVSKTLTRYRKYYNFVRLSK